MVNYDDGDGVDYDEMGFDDYVVSTIDPGPALMVVTIVFSVSMILLIPFCLALREKFRKTYRRRRNRYGPITGSEGIMKDSNNGGDGVFVTDKTQLPDTTETEPNTMYVLHNDQDELLKEAPKFVRDSTTAQEEVETVIDTSVLNYNFSDAKDSTSTRKEKKENKKVVKTPDLLSADLLGSHDPAPLTTLDSMDHEVEVNRAGTIQINQIAPQRPTVTHQSAARVIPQGPIDTDTMAPFEPIQEMDSDEEDDDDDDDSPAYGLPENEDEYDVDSQNIEVEYKPPHFFDTLVKYATNRKVRRLRSAANVVRAIPLQGTALGADPPGAHALGRSKSALTPQEQQEMGYQRYQDEGEAAAEEEEQDLFHDDEEDVLMNIKLDDDALHWDDELLAGAQDMRGVELTSRVKESIPSQEMDASGNLTGSVTKTSMVIEAAPVRRTNSSASNSSQQRLGMYAEDPSGAKLVAGPVATPVAKKVAYQPPTPVAPTPQQSTKEVVDTPEATAKTEEYTPSSPNDYFESVEKKIDVNLCCGKRPWWRFLCSKRFRNKVRKCASYDKEMKGLMKLAIPFTVQALLGHFFGLFEVAIIGRMLGTDELAAYYAVDFVMSLSTMALEGAGSSLFTLCSHAVGANMYHLAGQYVQLSVVSYQVCLIPAAAFWWYFMDDVVEWLGFEDHVAEIAYSYVRIVFIQYFLGPVDEAMHYLMETGGHEIDSAVIGLAHSLISFLCVLLVSIYGNPTLRDIGIIHLILQIVFTFVSIGSSMYFGWIHPYLKGMIGSNAFANRGAVKMFFKQAIPLSFGYIMAYGEWEILFIFAGYMGPAEVAVWGLMGSLWGAIEEIGLSTADAAEVRVSLLLGSDQPKRARYVAHKALFVGCIVATIAAIPLYLVRQQIPAWFTKDETLQRLFSDLVPYICVGNVTMMFGSMAWTLLGAQGRFGLATLMGFIGSWGLTLPLSLVSTYLLGFDLRGITASVVVGYACSGAFNSYFLLRSNWAKIARKIQRKNRLEEEGALGKAAEVGKYDKMNWKELPYNAQKAAMLLGFDERKWNKDKDPYTYTYTWDELQPNQQEAAILLGYEPETWGPGLVDDYDEYDWDALPEHIRDAYIVLGYTQELWNSETGEEPASCDKYFRKLTPEQQEAAKHLGYDQKKWDGIDE